MTSTVTASDSTAGTGRLVAGPASSVLRILRSDGVTTPELDVRTVEELLVDAAAIAP
jgi:hypothetical protein